MVKITKEAALLYHSQGKPGKIEVVPTKPYSTPNLVWKLKKTRKPHTTIQRKAT